MAVKVVIARGGEKLQDKGSGLEISGNSRSAFRNSRAQCRGPLWGSSWAVTDWMSLSWEELDSEFEDE